MTKPENSPDDADLTDHAAQWERKRFKGNKVWMAMDSQGRPLMNKNKVLIKYQMDQSYQYWVNADKIGDLIPEAARNVSASPSDQTAANKTKPRRTAPSKNNAPSAKAGKTQKIKPAQAQQPEAPIIHVYTDGASSGNPGPSGIGVLLQYGSHEREISRYIGTATNNIAELLAVKTALEAIKRTDRPVRLYTDSSYVHGLLTSGWKAHKNRQLVNEIRQLCTRFSSLELIKVKGHGGNEGNEKADHLATSAIKKNAP